MIRQILTKKTFYPCEIFPLTVGIVFILGKCSVNSRQKDRIGQSRTHMWTTGYAEEYFYSLFLCSYASKQNLYKPKERTNSGKQTVAFAASVLWDNIPVDLKSLNVFNFSKKLKHYLLSEQHFETLS